MVPRVVQVIHKRLHEDTQILPWVFRPWNDQRQEYGLPLHYDSGGRLSGITNMGQQMYEVVDIPYGLNPLVFIAILTFQASLA
jgi:hypothetical protein